MRRPSEPGYARLPASSVRISANVNELTGPVPFVVRSTVLSWMTTSTPSAVVCTSTST